MRDPRRQQPESRLVESIIDIVERAIDNHMSGSNTLEDFGIDIGDEVEEAVRYCLPDLVAEQVDDYMTNNFDPNDYSDNVITQDNLLSNVLAELEPKHARQILALALKTQTCQ